MTQIALLLELVFCFSGATMLLSIGTTILFDIIHYKNDKVDNIMSLLFKIAAMLMAFSAGISLIFYLLGEFPS